MAFKALIEQHVADRAGSPSWERAMAAMQRWRCRLHPGSLRLRRERRRGLRSSGHARLFRSEVGDESDTVAYWRVSIGAAYDANVIANHPRVPRTIFTYRYCCCTASMTLSCDRAIRRDGPCAGPTAQGESAGKLPGEDHWLSRSATRVRVLTEIDKFLAAKVPATAN